jgi:hypothetical protein
MNEEEMKRLISRLRSSLAASNQNAREEGKEAGIEWATESAEAAELIRIEQQYSEFDFFKSELPASDVLFGIIDPYAAEDGESGKSFWEDITGSANQLEDTFVNGFVEGAMQVWSSVKRDVLA